MGLFLSMYGTQDFGHLKQGLLPLSNILVLDLL